MKPAPPLALRALARLLTEGLSREGALGDLIEEHATRRGEKGRARAWLWTWGVAASVAGHVVAEGLRARRRRRRARSGGLMTSFGSDLRQAWRGLWRSPGFTLVAVLTLALGIGGDVAIFSVVRGVLLQPLPYDDPDGLVVVWESDLPRGSDREGASLPDYRDMRDRNHSFERMAARGRVDRTLARTDGAARRVDSSLVTASYLEMLGVSPLLGRGFVPADERPGSEPVVLLGEGLWRSEFGADPGVLGRALRLDGEARTVVGVAPETARLPFSTEEIFEPLVATEALDLRGRHGILALGRLRAGVTLEEAQRDMSAIMAQLEEEYPDDNQGRGAVVVPFHEQLTGEVRPALMLLLAAVGAVLLIACANVASLLLSRGLVRSRELGVRTALGAAPWRLARLMLTESLLLALLGGAAGVALAQLAVRALVAAAPADLPRVESIAIDGVVLLAALGLSLLTGLVFGLLPALRHAFSRPLEALRDGGRLTAGGGRARHALVVAQVALSVALVVASGLLIRSFSRLRDVDPGFRSDGLLLIDLALAGPEYPFPRGWPIHHWPQMDAFLEELRPRIEALPGVAALAVAHQGPVDPGWTTRVTVVGRPQPPPGEQDEASFRPVSPGYFATVGTALRRGRDFDRFDTGATPLVAIVNEAFVRRHLDDGDPLDQSINVFGAPRRVVGIASDVRVAGLDTPATPHMYLPLAQNPQIALQLQVRTRADASQVAALIREQVAAVDPSLALFDVRTAEAALEGSLAQRRFSTALLLLFAGVALVLAMVGVYGVVAYSVAQRTRELGVRLALGAAPRRLLAMVVGRGLALAGVALVLGFALSFATSRLLQGLLFGVSAVDPPTLLGVATLLAMAALAASIAPAWRAMRIDPLQALRAE